jgi:hypothetical protein
MVHRSQTRVLFSSVREVALVKPIVVIKAGLTSEASRAPFSHQAWKREATTCSASKHDVGDPLVTAIQDLTLPR